MKLTKIVPWNWFKTEEKEDVKNVPVEQVSVFNDPMNGLRREFDNIFNNALQNFGFHSFPFQSAASENTLLRPSVDISETSKEYKISVEIPGVDEDKIKLELNNGTLKIKGEKAQEKVEKEGNYHRVERSYGSFERVLTLPEDIKEENINASFNNGVLSIAIPRIEVIKSKPKLIAINKAA